MQQCKCLMTLPHTSYGSTLRNKNQNMQHLSNYLYIYTTLQFYNATLLLHYNSIKQLVCALLSGLCNFLRKFTAQIALYTAVQQLLYNEILFRFKRYLPLQCNTATMLHYTTLLLHFYSAFALFTALMCCNSALCGAETRHYVYCVSVRGCNSSYDALRNATTTRGR